ncbi:aminotransferase, classes I and II [Conidiobolus coronatus NRRL 28638]|uniref:Aminotransferase, classes I and II n=1 Tax=Conidiobolus coronatus (strain ATCC 28846 / CBS 209.66 / NRRL 28638) TaxID=796925 RepID=A0A137PI09_CONC2|nr:aminotransferase, classes I and II [Conidiobolus coronatus NRRL 28638]|eukprot:KXN74610.1 aminotransferase, classes I and II [Conidiobolus coronatus NRRL 28638]
MFKHFGLSNYIMSNEFTTQFVLCQSDSEPFDVKELFSLGNNPKEVLEEFLKLELGYTPADGIDELRELIASKLYLSGKIKAENINIHGGGSNETIWTTTFSFLKPDDHVIVQSGYYFPLYEVPRARGCKITEWNAQLDGDKWEFSLDSLKRHLRKETKLLIVNHPHNPSGYQFTEDQKRSLVKFANDHNLILVADEIYRWSNHDGSKASPSISELGNNVISIGGLSKSFGLPGLRIGWVASRNLDYLSEISETKHYGSVCPSAPSQFLAAYALKHRDEIIKRNSKIYQSNLVLIREFFAKYGDYFKIDLPVSGTVGLVTLKKDKWAKFNSARDFCLLAKENGILIAPGDLFHVNNHPEYNWSFRVGYGRRNFPKNWGAFTDFIDRLLADNSIKGRL